MFMLIIIFMIILMRIIIFMRAMIFMIIVILLSLRKVQNDAIIKLRLTPKKLG